MNELEKVEKLREKADVSFAEAKEALDYADGDVLGALIYLEKQGKSTVPAGGGFFSGAGSDNVSSMPEQEFRGNRNYRSNKSSANDSHRSSTGRSEAQRAGESFKDMMKRFGQFCLRMLEKGNSNYLDARKNDNLAFSCPVTAVVALVVFLFWITIPLFIISIFCGYRYSFRGEDLGRESINRVMENAASVVEDVKKSFANNAKTTGAGERHSDEAANDAEDSAEDGDNTAE